MNMFKRTLTMLLALCMLLSVIPMSAVAEEVDTTEPAAELTNQPAPAAEPGFERILHLDCGRKYFTKDWIIALINEMSAAGYTHLQLAFGNDGLRFLLDDMSVTVDGTSYSSENVTAGVKQGNRNYYDSGVNELTQTEMNAIIAHANSKGIQIIPHMNMPGHMDAIVDAIEYVGISDAHFVGRTTSVRSLNLNNDAAVAFTQALLQKYVDYFASKGCSYFHIGADEFANDAYNGNMGFPSMGATLYAKFATFVNDCAAIVKGKGMTPRAWNDGISYGSYTASFDTDIQITYWSSGWSGYSVASASKLRNNGHEMINTNGDYYFIVNANNTITNPTNSALNFDNSTFTGGKITDPVGSMFCIWCDSPGSATEQEIAEAVRITMRKMAAAMQDSTSYSQDVVPGGFNADGTISESREWVTISQGDVKVSGYDLTRAEVTQVPAEEMPTVDDVKNALAWNVVPYVGDEAYTDRCEVSLPVLEGWNTALVTGFYVENGRTVMVDGTYADGYFTFEKPASASAVGIAELAYQKLIELNLGESKTETIEGVDLSGQTFTPDPAGIATVTTQVYTASGEMTLERVNSLADLISGEEYVLDNVRSGNALGDATGGTFYRTYIVQVEGNATVNSAPWTITASGQNYHLTNSAGKYMTIGNNSSNLSDSAANLKIGDYGNGTFSIAQSSAWNTYYLIDINNQGNFAGGSTRDTGGAWRIFRLVESQVTGGTVVTFTGDARGEAYVTINNTVYKIIVHGEVPITVRYVDEEGNEVKTETRMVADNATSCELSDFSYNGKFYVVEEKTLAIDPMNTTSYTVTVIETEEDLDAVPSLTIEYWQTNLTVRDGDDINNISRDVAARDAFSENGIAVRALVPENPRLRDASADDPILGFWRARLLVRETNEQTGDAGDDETLNGVTFTRVRYWNGKWGVLTNDGEWTEIEAENLAEYQFVFYFMNDMNLADEVQVSTSDWGKMGDGTLAENYLGNNHVSLAFQVVYEDGTTSPATTTAADLDSSTYLVDSWGNRGVGVIAINEIADYQIWKVTAETGTHTTRYSGAYEPAYVTKFTWDNNEMTVWEGDPVSSYTIVNPAGSPSTEGAYENLTWDERNESILIRIYIKAVETEDSLHVVYVDETFGDTLYTYNVLVPGDTNFTDDIEGETAFAGNDQRIDVSGAYIVNNQNKPQYFQTDLSGVPQVVGKFNSNLYTYTGSEISEDGKTLYLYYNFDESALPAYVADFGLPLTFSLLDLTQAEVSGVTVTEQTRYGRLSYRSDPKNIGGIFIYQPTSILQGADMLTINIKFADGSTSTSNIMVLPATSVYYEEGFIFNENSTGWENTGNKGQYMQYTEVLGRKVNNYGYDDVYTDTPGASCESNATASQIGAKTTFTFTGNGIQIFANATEESGYVAVEVKDSTGKVVNVSMVDTVVKGGETDATEGQEGNLYGLPIVSLVDLQNMPHGTYTVKLTKIMNDKPVYIDGIRVFNTMADSSVYAEDLEDNPEFYELRDYVLNAVQIDDETSKDYGTLAEMANQVYAGISTDTEAPVAMVTTGIGDVYGDGATAQDLLDNGPKNELYLYPGQTLSFKVATARVMQIGLKAPSGSTSAAITVDGTARTQRITSSVDMFYSLTTQPGTEQEHLISITNAGENILSVTLLKVCDDPDFAFGALTEQDVEKLLQASFRASGESPVLTGDVDGDWDVDAADLTLVARHVGGIELLSDEMLKNADVDGNGIVNARDLTIHARFTGGIILRWKDDADQTA